MSSVIDQSIRYAISISQDRDIMMMERSYIPGRTFLASTTWFAKKLRGVKTLYDRTASFPMKCSIVGVVSTAGLHLDSHGDFSVDKSGELDGRLRDAHYKITLERPGSESPFSRDFDNGVSCIKELISNLPDTRKTSLPFLNETDGGVTLNFTRPVFDRFANYGRNMFDNISPSPLEHYRVAPEVRPFLEEIKDQYLAKNLYVWDQNGVAVPAVCRKAFLENKIVQIYFCMYYSPRNGLVSEFNTVSAFEDDVVVWSDYIL